MIHLLHMSIKVARLSPGTITHYHKCYFISSSKTDWHWNNRLHEATPKLVSPFHNPHHQWQKWGHKHHTHLDGWPHNIYQEQVITMYCNLPALGRDSAHIIITPSLSNIYAQSLMSPSGYTSSEFTPWYPWSIWFSPYWLTVWLVICQDSKHCGTSSGLDIQIGKWVPIGDCWLGLHMGLGMSSTWSSHPNG